MAPMDRNSRVTENRDTARATARNPSGLPCIGIIPTASSTARYASVSGHPIIARS